MLKTEKCASGAGGEEKRAGECWEMSVRKEREGRERKLRKRASWKEEDKRKDWESWGNEGKVGRVIGRCRRGTGKVCLKLGMAVEEVGVEVGGKVGKEG